MTAMTARTCDTQWHNDVTGSMKTGFKWWPFMTFKTVKARKCLEVIRVTFKDLSIAKSILCNIQNVYNQWSLITLRFGFNFNFRNLRPRVYRSEKTRPVICLFVVPAVLVWLRLRPRLKNLTSLYVQYDTNTNIWIAKSLHCATLGAITSLISPTI